MQTDISYIDQNIVEMAEGVMKANESETNAITSLVVVSKEELNANSLLEESYRKSIMILLDKIDAYERKINNWFVIIIANDSIDFEQFYYENKPSELLEKKVAGLKEYRLQQTLEAKKKVGRNETCPCGSGEKYKRCCL